MKIGVIADDFTGATDIAGFLVAGGLTTTQMIGVPDADAQVDADAVVISLKSRSNPAADAVADSLAALDWLRARGCAQIYQKYCSTFDSTAAGNIGAVADALMAALGTDITVICPALPVNGRSVYLGHLFVGQDLLQDSGMRDHPITPMRDSSLIRLMEGQAQGRCGLVDAATVDQGPQAVRDRIAALRTDCAMWCWTRSATRIWRRSGRPWRTWRWSPAGRGWDTASHARCRAEPMPRPKTRARRWRGRRW